MPRSFIVAAFIALAATPLTGWCGFSTSQSLVDCVAQQDFRTDFFGGPFTLPWFNTIECPVDNGSVNGIANTNITVTRQHDEGPNHPLPYSVTVSARTTYDNAISSSVTETALLSINPPPGVDDPGAVTFYLLDRATFDLSTSPPAGAAHAFLQIASPKAANLFVRVDKLAPGHFVEDVKTPQVTIRCCSLLVQLTAFAGAAGFASTELADPLEVVLTPDEVAAGWTWTLTNAAAPVPEPTELIVLALGLAALAGYTKLRKPGGLRQPESSTLVDRRPESS
jgi:hypothetical protein